jgi:hypothetical protein
MNRILAEFRRRKGLEPAVADDNARPPPGPIAPPEEARPQGEGEATSWKQGTPCEANSGFSLNLPTPGSIQFVWRNVPQSLNQDPRTENRISIQRRRPPENVVQRFSAPAQATILRDTLSVSTG